MLGVKVKDRDSDTGSVTQGQRHAASRDWTRDKSLRQRVSVSLSPVRVVIRSLLEHDSVWHQERWYR